MVDFSEAKIYYNRCLLCQQIKCICYIVFCMQLKDYKQLNIPDVPGVYFFMKGDTVLYIGKATSLKERVRSYFNDDLIHTRGRLLVDMVAQAETLTWSTTDSVLEAFILETELIKKHLPKYNTKEKDNKSFNYVVFTKEEFPRVLVVRGRNLQISGQSPEKQKELLGYEYTHVFGPYPFGAELREALRLIRKIFPFRDKCEVCIENKKRTIVTDGSTISAESKKCRPCFNRTIGLCPGVCTGEISKAAYAKRIEQLALFFKGEKLKVVERLEKDMKQAAKELRFEDAHEIKKTLYALSHIHDISLIKKESEYGSNAISTAEHSSRIEAYDIAHMSGKDMVGAMVVMEDGEFSKKEYKKFNIKNFESADDTGALKQILERRFFHPEWKLPTHIVLDGGVAQMNVAEKVLETLVSSDTYNSETKNKLKNIHLVAITKDDKHKAKQILVSKVFCTVPMDVTKSKNENIVDDGDYISINQECHRFAIQTHRKKRSMSRGL